MASQLWNTCDFSWNLRLGSFHLSIHHSNFYFVSQFDSLCDHNVPWSIALITTFNISKFSIKRVVVIRMHLLEIFGKSAFGHKAVPLGFNVTFGKFCLKVHWSFSFYFGYILHVHLCSLFQIVYQFSAMQGQ